MGQALESDMVTAPRVTVLMSVYDPPVEMLNKAVASLLAQTLVDFELLILNDGGSDPRARARLDSYGQNDSRVRVSHEPHRGIPGTSNQGLKMARGEYIARHDADDWSEPHRLERQCAYLEAHPDVSLVSADTESHSADGGPLWRLRLPHRSNELARALWKGNPFVHGATMFRRQQALAIGGYREAFPCSSDYDFLWRLTEAGKAVNLDEVLYHYRYTGGSISAQRAADQARVFRAAQKLARARRRGEAEDVAGALAAAGAETASEAFRVLLKQADHRMLAGDFSGARQAYRSVLVAHPWSGLAWAKMIRLAVFRAVPPVREVCFR
jgi:glycosyltransferase involved in cell wall biosynthesis